MTDLFIHTSVGLAVDWINDRIYYSFSTTSTTLPNHLAVYDISTGENTDITVVVDENRTTVIYDIAVDPLEG